MYANMKRMNHDMAVSPIVATLVLIVVAVIGAVAVGTIMGTFSTSVSKQANTGQAASAAQTEILVAGSTTLQPVEMNLAADYNKLNPGIQINVQGGGSGAGVSSVAMGISDIGASSSASKITSAETANPNTPGYQNLYVAIIGGRGVAWCTNAASPAVNSSTPVAAADLAAAYNNALSTGANNASAAFTGNISTSAILVSRSDSSGTEDDASNWLFGTTGMINSTHSVTENGNEGVRSYIATTPYALGFVDAGWALQNPSGITILSVTDWPAGTTPEGWYKSTGRTYAAVSTSSMTNALKDWYYGNAQDTTSPTISAGVVTKNYPQGLVGGMYWITPSTVPTTFTQRGTINVQGSSASSSTIKDLLNFAQSPGETTAYTTAGDVALNQFM
jgi:phosphate transport system substrate-binding protein